MVSAVENLCQHHCHSEDQGLYPHLFTKKTQIMLVGEF